jgi:hypothetical protein
MIFKNVFFCSRCCWFLLNFHHNIHTFFHRKQAKIAENCDHNIDPWGQYQGALMSL